MANPKIEELPDDFDDKIDLNKTAAPAPTPADPLPAASLDAMLSQMPLFPPKNSAQPSPSPSHPGAAMPPAMESVKQHTADEVLAMMNRTPLFMTSLDESGDGDEGENVELEALKALAYEGTPAEVAGNFREQGNEMARMKQWKDAREYYTRAIAALKLPIKPQDKEEGPADMEVVEVDEESERRKQREVEEASYVNRALCNLEMSTTPPCPPEHDATLHTHSPFPPN